MVAIRCKCIVKGIAHGEALVSDTPINFLTMIDPGNGEVRDPNHQLYGDTLKGRIFVFPYSVGSSVGAYLLYRLKKNMSAPLAIICSNRMDITTASGCAISNIPAVQLKCNSIPQILRNNLALTVDGESERIWIS
jgi:predicted aconitase with swiveling domain